MRQWSWRSFWRILDICEVGRNHFHLWGVVGVHNFARCMRCLIIVRGAYKAAWNQKGIFLEENITTVNDFYSHNYLSTAQQIYISNEFAFDFFWFLSVFQEQYSFNMFWDLRSRIYEYAAVTRSGAISATRLHVCIINLSM